MFRRNLTMGSMESSLYVTRATSYPIAKVRKNGIILTRPPLGCLSNDYSPLFFFFFEYYLGMGQ